MIQRSSVRIFTIVADKDDGPRANPGMTNVQGNSYGNRILCVEIIS